MIERQMGLGTQIERGFDSAIAAKVSNEMGFPVTFGEVGVPEAESDATATSYTETAVSCPLSGDGIVELGRYYAGGYGRSSDTINVSFEAGSGMLAIGSYDQSHLEYEGQIQTMERVVISADNSNFVSEEILDDKTTSSIAYDVEFSQDITSIDVNHLDINGEEGTPNSLNVCVQFIPEEKPPETTTTTTSTTTTAPPPATTSTTTTSTTTTTTLPPIETTTTTTTPEETTTTTEPPTIETTTTTTEAPPPPVTNPPRHDAGDRFETTSAQSFIDNKNNEVDAAAIKISGIVLATIGAVAAFKGLRIGIQRRQEKRRIRQVA